MRTHKLNQSKGRQLAAPALCLCLTVMALTAGAAPRRLSDAELDRVCAKGSAGASDHLVLLRAIQFDFAHSGISSQVTGSGRLFVESNTSDPSRVQVSSGQPLRLAKNPDGRFSSVTNGAAFRGLQLRAKDAAVRVTADFDVSVKTTSNQSLRGSRDNALLRPAGLMQAAAGAAARRQR
jgi:hypothetical protein